MSGSFSRGDSQPSRVIRSVGRAGNYSDNIMVRSFVFSLTLLVGFLFTSGAFPAEGQDRIAAVVNDEVISMLDVEMRMKLVISSSGLPENTETREHLLPQIMRMLVDERLKLQEAASLKIKITDADMKEAEAFVEHQNNLPPGGFAKFLSEHGIDRTSALAQLRADVAWIRVVQQTIRPLIKVGDDEVDAELRHLRAVAGRPEVLWAEIVLPIDVPGHELEVRQLIDRLVQQMRDGANFQAIARQFSQSASAASGGDMGWTAEGQVDEEIDKALRHMEPGQLAVIRTLSGYHVLLLRDRRQTAAVEGSEAKITLSQIFIPTTGPEAAPEPLRQQVIDKATAIKDSCEPFNALATELKTPRSGSLGTLKIADLPESLRSVVLSLPLNTPSKPVTLPSGGIAVLMVCARDTPSDQPQREAIMRRLENDRVEMISRRRLRDLRRAAYVDVRL
ncbi:MAG: peptidylprolyl isomerase [Alphaproteobacteria bacterium]|nr:peptidylprolyl isomerase [Alphaproteobacteria bacterium]